MKDAETCELVFEIVMSLSCRSPEHMMINAEGPSLVCLIIVDLPLLMIGA